MSHPSSTTTTRSTTTTTTAALRPQDTPSAYRRFHHNHLHDPGDLSSQEIYDYYVHILLPAIVSSIPLLTQRMLYDTQAFLSTALGGLFRLLLPQWSSHSMMAATVSSASSSLSSSHHLLDSLLWWDGSGNNSTASTTTSHSSFLLHNASLGTLHDSFLKHFDTNNDGAISAEEVVNMTEMLHRWWWGQQHRPPSPQTWWTWFATEWPLMDWKLGVFLWRTFGGLLFLLALLSVTPGPLHGLSGRLLRWPVLALTYSLIWSEFVVYTVIRIVIRLAEYLVANPKHSKLRRRMAHAQSYQEWYQYASELDISQKRDRWLELDDQASSDQYNFDFIKDIIRDLKSARDRGDTLLALAVIQQCTRPNVGGIMSQDLFSYANTGQPKKIVREFIQEAVETLQWITRQALRVPENKSLSSKENQQFEEAVQSEYEKEKSKLWNVMVSFFDGSQRGNDDGSTSQQSQSQQDSQGSTNSIDECNNPEEILPFVHREHVLGFLRRARSTYGQTALCLSGGAMMGLYHFGCIKGLLEQDLLPKIVSGTSAGSAIGALICTRTVEELKEVMQPEILAPNLACFTRNWKERLESLWKTGHMFDPAEWMAKLSWFTNGDMTFEEAYQKTGRVLCVTLTSTTKKAPPVLLNYLSAPNVTLASAVLASAAVPGFIPPIHLRYKDSNGQVRKYGDNDQTYYDGSIQTDIPRNALAEMLNCQFFIACQCNPHIVPFFFNPKGGVGRPSRWSSGNQEHSWRGGFLLAALEMYLKTDMKAKFQFLHDLEAAVGFTSTLLVQGFEGTTTIVPQVSFSDYFWLFENPTVERLRRHFQAGAIASYEQVAMLKLNQSIANTLDECIRRLENKIGARRLSLPYESREIREVVTDGPLETLIAEAIRVRRTGEAGAISFGALSFEDDDFIPIDSTHN